MVETHHTGLSAIAGLPHFLYYPPALVTWLFK